MSIRAIKLVQLFLLVLVLLGFTPFGFHYTGAAQGISLYTPYTEISVPPGESIEYSIKAINNSGSIKTAAIEVSGLPEGWTYELKSGGWSIGEISVLPREKETLSLNVDVPLKVDKGTYHFQVLAKGHGRLLLTVIVSEQGTFKTEFSTAQPNMEGAANSKFTYASTLYNRTADDQVYAIRAQSLPGWNVTFKADYKQVSSVKIAANTKKDITIEVDPPDQIKAGKYEIPIMAGTNATSARLTLEVVVTGSYSLELTTPTGLLSTAITAGGRKRIELAVKNTGSATLKNLDMQFSAPTDWDVIFEPKKIEQIEPGKAAQVFATIQVSNKAIVGDYVVNLEAKAPEVSSKAAFRVAVKTFWLWGWLGILIILAALGGVYYLIRKYGRR